jgi:hypothetical protein
VATIAFSGGVALSTGANNAFTATNGGTVTVGGQQHDRDDDRHRIERREHEYRAERPHVPQHCGERGANGIILNSTGTTAGVNGGLTVTGTGTAGSGGTIQNIANRGASFINARDTVANITSPTRTPRTTQP